MAVSEKVPSIITGRKDLIDPLYQPFCPRDASPTHYDWKLDFWLKALNEYCLYTPRISFTLKELKFAFTIDGKSPAGLSTVIDELCSDGKVAPERNLCDHFSSTSTWKILQRMSSFMTVPNLFRSEENIRYVSIYQIETMTGLLQNDAQLTGQIMSVATWKSKVADLTKIKASVDIDILVGYLKSRKCIIVDKVGTEDVLKMSSVVGAEATITDVEKGKYHLARMNELLHNQLQMLKSEKATAEEMTRAALKQGLKNDAKVQWRQKKRLDKMIEKLLSAQDNLAELQFQIRAAELQTAISSTYETGKNALRTVLSEENLKTDRITDTMLDIQELLEQQAEINTALAQPVEIQDADLGDLEGELEELLKEEQKTEPDKDSSAIASSLEALGLDGPQAPKRAKRTKTAVLRD